MKFAMSTLGVVVIILVVGQTLAGKDEEFEPVRKLCLERNNITEEEFKALTDEKEVEGIASKFKCFSHCVVKEMGYLDEAGKLDMEKLKEEGEMGETELAKVTECKTKHDAEDDPCEYSFLIFVCIIGLM